METTVATSGLSTRELWAINTRQRRFGEPTAESGAELMRRTDTSPNRRTQSNFECAERRDMARTRP